MRGTRLYVLFAAAALWAGAAVAFDEGDLVIVTEPADVRVPTGKVGTVEPGESLFVEKVNDKWLWVTIGYPESKKGWVDSAKVVKQSEALDYFAKRIEKNPQDAAAYAARANMHESNLLTDKQAWDKALPDYDMAIKLGMKTPKMYCQRGILQLMVQDKLDEALADFNEALRLDPKFAEVYDYRAAIWEEKEQYDKALADYKRLVELEPQNATSLAGLAMFYASCPDSKLRNARQAVSVATRACQMSQWTDGNCLDSLAAAYAESSNFPKAVEYGQKAVELAPERSKDEFGKRLALYKEKKPYRFTPESKMK